MPVSVYAHSAVVLSDTSTEKIVFVCGGITDMGGNARSACYVYDEINDVWTTMATMNEARYGHGMAVCRGIFLPDHS
jgi:hypothetical protein